MTQEVIGKNMAVYITYSITGEEGELLERSDLPVGYLHGHQNRLHDRIEAELTGKSAGETVAVALESGEGFGEYDNELTFTDSVENVPEQFRHVGAEVEMTNDQGETKTFKVSQIEDGKLTVDGNHPFAGRSVNYLVKVVDVRLATEDEINAGEVMPMGAPAAGVH